MDPGFGLLLWACSEARHQVEKDRVKRAASVVITGEQGDRRC